MKTATILAILVAAAFAVYSVPSSAKPYDAPKPAQLDAGAFGPDAGPYRTLGDPGDSVAPGGESDAKPAETGANAGTVERIVRSIRNGDYREAIAMALILITAAGLRWGRKIPGGIGEWFTSDEGGSWFAFGMAGAGTLGTSLLGAPWEWSMLRDAFTAAVLAVGSYSIVWKRMICPIFVRFGWLNQPTKSDPRDPDPAKLPKSTAVRGA